jgi:hypothetical protein
MGNDRVQKRWRRHLVDKLQERYGLAEEEALNKAERWLQWIAKMPAPQPQIQAASPSAEKDAASRLRAPSGTRAAAAGRRF